MIQNIKLYLLENNTGQIPGVKENPRDLTGDGFAKAKQSIKDFPEMLDVRTLVAVEHGDRFVVIGGNQRLRAMRDLDYDNAPVMVVDWSVDKINEFIIKDNVEYGVWNFDLLANEWDSNLLVDWGMNLPVDFGDVDDITEGLTDENEVPEILPNPKSKIGDVWICGNHRVMCGDSTSIDAVEKLMNGEKADMVFTDPPYGMFLDTDYTKMPKAPNGAKPLKHSKIQGDNNDFTPELINTIFASFDYCKEIFIWGADYFAELIPNKNDGSWIVWDKRANGNDDIEEDYSSDKMYGSCFELCWSKNKHKRDIARVKWAGVFGTEQEFDHKRYHPTQKPIKLAEWFLKRYSKDGHIVVDLFGGSGSTLIACEQLDRTCYMMELDPKYCDVIIKRWQDFTGKDAILESTQQKFNEL